MNKFFPALLLLLFVLPLAPSVSAADWQETATASFDYYFHVWAISGSVSDSTPTLTWDLTKEYFEFTITITPSSSNATVEFTVPDCYMGADLYVSSVLKTGNAAYTLSVPYAYNSTDPPAKDWGSGTLASPTGEMGVYKRVMLYKNDANPTTLLVRVYYATAPAVGFDGVDDYILVSDDDTLDITTGGYVFYGSLQSANGYLSVIRKEGTYIMGLGSANLHRAHVVTDDYHVVQKEYQPDILSYISMSYNSTNGYLSNYVNGNKQGADFSDLNIAVTGSAIYIGCAWAGSEETRLRMYFVKIYNETFTDGECNGTRETGINLFFNASSFSGGASATVNDFSASDNDGNAYGNVQYKVYSGSGFQFTIPGSVWLTMEWGSYPPAGTSDPAINSTTEYIWGASETLYAYILSPYYFSNFTVGGVAYANGSTLTLSSNATAYLYAVDEATMYSYAWLSLAVLLIFFGVELIFYLKGIPLFVIVAGVTALLVNVLSVSAGIPFTPYIQMLFSIIELVMMAYIAQKVR